MCHTQYKKQKIIWTLSSILCKRLQLISVKTHQMKKIQTHHYSLKYKKLNMQICQLWSVVIFFFLKSIDYSWLGMQILRSIKKKIRRFQDFLHHFCTGETENQINFDIITEKQ
jgi:hypothetical protein